MTAFTYYPNIPNAPDSPSFDQPLMQINAQSTNSILGVDHVTFNSSGTGGPSSSGGQHLQVTFNGKNVPGGAPTDPLSILYTNNVIAGASNTASASTVAEVFFRNQNATYPVTLLRAYGVFDGTAVSLNTYNMTATRVSVGLFTLTMPANVVTGVAYGVLIGIRNNTLNPANTVNYTILSATQFQVAFRNGANTLFDPDGFTVMVLQL